MENNKTSFTQRGLNNTDNTTTYIMGLAKNQARKISDSLPTYYYEDFIQGIEELPSILDKSQQQMVKTTKGNYTEGNLVQKTDAMSLGLVALGISYLIYKNKDTTITNKENSDLVGANLLLSNGSFIILLTKKETDGKELPASLESEFKKNLSNLFNMMNIAEDSRPGLLSKIQQEKPQGSKQIDIDNLSPELTLFMLAFSNLFVRLF